MDNRKDLKIQALREKISEMVTQYEDRVADLRVELTITTQERDELRQRLNELEQNVQTTEVVEGEVVADSADEVS